MKLHIYITVFISIFSAIAFSTTIKVPGDRPTIQDAIDIASKGDMVLVAPGTYYERIDFKGKMIKVKSSGGPFVTVLDGEQLGSVVTFKSIESVLSTLDGFTITNGSGTKDFEGLISGGGIYCKSSSPTLMNNIIENNHVPGSGGGLQMTSSKSPMISNIIRNNSAGAFGGGIDSAHSLLKMNNNLLANNTGNLGGGIACRIHATPTEILNTTIVGNIASGAKGQGGALYCETTSNCTVKNSILWGNSAKNGNQIYLSNSNPPVTYCNVQGGWPGAGNINSDPLFAPGMNGVYYLSDILAGQIGTSPCVNAGSDLASAIGYDVFWTRTDGVFDTAALDIGFHYGAFAAKYTAPLYSDLYAFDEITGGTAGFFLNAGDNNAARGYLVLGTVSGSSPGIMLPGGVATLPLNWDLFTSAILANLNSPIFQDFMGTLDASGQASAQLLFPPAPGTAGLKLTFAYALNGPWNYASNPVTIDITP